MSTTPTTPSDPWAMPMDQLKDAAGISNPPVASSPGGSEPPQPPTPPAAPAPPPAPIVPEAYSVQQDDNGITVTLSPEFGGEVFKGKDWAEVAPKVLKAKADANAYIKQLKNQPAPTTQAPVVEPPKTPQQIAEEETRNWLLEQQAIGLGFKSAAEMKAALEMIHQTSQKMAVNTSFAEFAQICPDYNDTPENAQVLASYFPENMDHFPTPRELKAAYAQALYDGKLTRTIAAPPVQRQPVPMTSGTASSVAPGAPTENPWAMDITALGKAAGILK